VDGSSSRNLLTPTTTFAPLLDGPLDLVRGFLDLALLVAGLDGRERAAQGLDLLEVVVRGRLEAVRERLDVVAAGQRIRRLGHARLVGEDLLGPRARRAASAVGSARASSRELVWRLWAPPRTAARAWTVVRTTLLSIDWAVSDEPAVWTWKRHAIERCSWPRTAP
jgi:hypothetical protein